jgi:hypothetical protein
MCNNKERIFSNPKPLDRVLGKNEAMKWNALLLLALLFAQCQKESLPREFEAEVVGIGPDCGLPLIDFSNATHKVALIAESAAWGRYYAYNLDRKYWKAGQKLRVHIRKPTADELHPCTTLGPSYPWITIIAAWPVE